MRLSHLLFLFFLFPCSPITLNKRILVDCDTKTNSLLACYQNCRITYNGTKNYFNQTTGMCEVVSKCDNLSTYDYLTNTCSPIKVDLDNFPAVNNTQTSTNTTGKITLVLN